MVDSRGSATNTKYLILLKICGNVPGSKSTFLLSASFMVQKLPKQSQIKLLLMFERWSRKRGLMNGIKWSVLGWQNQHHSHGHSFFLCWRNYLFQLSVYLPPPPPPLQAFGFPSGLSQIICGYVFLLSPTSCPSEEKNILNVPGTEPEPACSKYYIMATQATCSLQIVTLAAAHCPRLQLNSLYHRAFVV